ncbi:MAG: hypothetical protein R3D84_09080 [Paracoccaceae bacterium]
MELAVASGLMGNREAIDFLIETFSAPNLDAERLSYPSAAFELMARVDDPRVLAIFRTALVEYGEAMHALMMSGEQHPQRSSHGLLFHHIPLAMEYVAVFGDEGDQALLAVPVGGSRLVDSTIAGLLADPVAVYLDMVGVTPRPQPVSDYGAYQMVNYGVLMCRALERRDATTREAFLEDFRYLAGEVLNTAYFGMTNDRAPGIVGRAVTNITTAYCNPNDRAASARRSDPRNLEVFADPITNFVWDDRPVRAEMALEGFDPTGRLWPNMAMLSQMPPADVLARMDADARFNSPLGAALRLNVRALDYRYVEPAADIYPGGANRRVFLTALAASDEEAVVSGRVDLSPILADGELQLGLRLRVVYDEKGFLSPQMSGRDVAMKAALSDAARGLVREVRLEGPDGDRPVPFRQTTEGGVHVFALPFAADDPAGFSVIVELEVFEQRWTLRFPLSYGDFAFRHRSKLP